MFGSDMLSKLSAMKQMADESKKKLDNIIVEGESGNGLVIISLSGNRELKSIKINADIKMMETEDLEDLLSVALKRAMDNANALNEKEVMNSAKNMFPGM
jgi:DNA-binding YbaB/EbfC family protein